MQTLSLLGLVRLPHVTACSLPGAYKIYRTFPQLQTRPAEHPGQHQVPRPGR